MSNQTIFVKPHHFDKAMDHVTPIYEQCKTKEEFFERMVRMMAVTYAEMAMDRTEIERLMNLIADGVKNRE